MNIYVILSAVLAIALYIPLSIQILKGKTEQNLATWFLWAALDAVAAISLFTQQGNFLMVAAYTLGSSWITMCIAKSGNFSWTKFETLVTIMVIACLIGWILSGPRTATVLSSIAVVIAGGPQLRDTAKDPWSAPFLIYFGFFTANTLSVIGAKNWSIEEVFYPSCCAVYCGVLVLIASRKFWLQKPATTPDFTDLSSYKFT